ncbi:hypothetical protein SKAU_G00144830 [Synaphobranchus kaupii]|uniref:Uncharacterized protein n=1 Tax=Synaphobranchus kaupii TaxID=118154 RepID=A0A9Q1FTZ0_SYNKA|nr:hypothetical protein SKAU_G00144830 [Synaphobranchus kaupii]
MVFYRLYWGAEAETAARSAGVKESSRVVIFITNMAHVLNNEARKAVQPAARYAAERGTPGRNRKETIGGVIWGEHNMRREKRAWEAE